MYRKMDLMKVFKTYNDVIKVMFNDQATEITEKKNIGIPIQLRLQRQPNFRRHIIQ